MSPNPAPLPCSAGQPPFETHRAALAPGAANVISPSKGVHAVSAQQRGFGRGVASGLQVSVALPALRPVRQPGALRPLWRIVLRGSGLKAPRNQRRCGVAVPTRRTGSGPPKPGPSTQRHFLDTGDAERVASRLR
jgi:hypothetical protein